MNGKNLSSIAIHLAVTERREHEFESPFCLAVLVLDGEVAKNGQSISQQTHPLWQDGAAVWGTKPIHFGRMAPLFGEQNTHPLKQDGARTNTTHPCPRSVREHQFMVAPLLKGCAIFPLTWGTPVTVVTNKAW